MRISFVADTPGYKGDDRINSYCEIRNITPGVLRKTETFDGQPVFYLDVDFQHDAFDVIQFIRHILVVTWLHVE